MSRLKVMTYNVRFKTSRDGINVFDARRPYIKEVILREKPDVIGFQETTSEMTECLRADLKTRYRIVGCGREQDRNGEGTRIAYNDKKFELLYLETFWLSETPTVPGSRFAADQSQCPRVTTVVELMEKKTGSVFRMYNTHLDHKGEYARVCGAAEILQRMEADDRRLTCPVILTGDFNALPDSVPVKTLSARLNDLTTGLGRTFHGFGKYTDNDPLGTDGKIDYIFTNTSDDPKKSYIAEDIPQQGVYASDHFAVCGFVTI